MLKKIVFILIVISCTCLFATENPIASLSFYLGQVNFKAKSTNNWVPVKKGMPFFEGDTLKTMDDGKAELFFYSGTKVRIANGTEIEFTKDDKKDTKSVFLNLGKVWSQVRKGDKFEVESVHGVASVKGTEFDIANDGKEMNIWVAEGVVLVHNENGQVLAEKNTKTSIKKDDKPDKKNISRNDLPKWKDEFVADALLVVNIPGNKTENKPFKIFITLKDPKSDRLFGGEVAVVIKSLNNNLKLSTEESGQYTSNLDVKIIAGKTELFAKGTAGKAEINLAGRNFTGQTIPIDIMEVISKREVSLKFLGKDFKEHSINIKYKLK